MDANRSLGNDKQANGRRFSRRQMLRTSGVGLAAAGFAATGLGRAAAQDGPTEPPAPVVTPERMAAALTGLDALAAATMQKTGVPGIAVAVVANDDGVALRGYGVRDVEGGEPVDADTVFQLASVSKSIASTVVAGVVGDGAASWDSRLSDLTPDFELLDPWPTREVTLRDLFSHRSGLPDHAGDLLEDIGFDRTTILHRLRYLMPDYSFRAGYEYTNFGLTAAAVAAATAAGQSWEDLSAARLYQPLGMTRTSSRFADFEAAANRARGHVLIDGKWVAKYVRDPDAQSPAGGVSSTVRDLAQWLRLQLGGGKVDGKQVVATDALTETHRPHSVSRAPADPDAERTGFYGLGWNVAYDDQGKLRLSHSGAFALGAATAVVLLPASDLGVVVLTNAAPIGVAETIAFGFVDLALLGKVQYDYLSVVGPIVEAAAGPDYGTAHDYSKPAAQPGAPLAATAYAGAYRNDFVGEIEVAAEGDNLVLRLGPNLDAYPLRHYDRDVFAYQPTGENAGPLSGVTFTVGADETATGVVIENLNIYGGGSFSRRADVAAPLASTAGASGGGVGGR